MYVVLGIYNIYLLKYIYSIFFICNNGQVYKERKKTRKSLFFDCHTIQTTWRQDPILSSRVNGNTSSTGTLIPLRSDNHVVKGPQRHAGLLPGIKEVARSHGTAGPLRPADGPVLVKGLGPIDGRRIRPRGLVQVICRTVRRDGALLGGPGGGAWVIFAKVFEDVIFY